VSRQEKRSARHVLRPTTPGEITHHFSQACHSAGSFAPFAGLRQSHGEPAGGKAATRAAATSDRSAWRAGFSPLLGPAGQGGGQDSA